MTLETLTLISTTFIVLSGVSLLVGWFFIRWQKNMDLHKNMMFSATTFAGLFLVAYVTRWYLYGSKAFEGTGAWRVFYIANLIPHIIFATAVGPLALYLIYLAWYKRDFRTHRKIARFTFPMWLYVAGSGWLIYYLLYQMQF